MDDDGDLDLAFADGDALRLYRNAGGVLAPLPSWTSDLPGLDAVDLSWGDYDGDGALDLAVAGGSSTNSLLLHNDVSSAMTLVWTAPETDVVTGLAWGDLDRDGDVDLAVTFAGGAPDRLYPNDGGLGPAIDLPIPAATASTSLAWGDADQDGDLDLAVGVDNGADHVLENVDGALELAWSGGASTSTRGVAWGDVDGDGDLDLATVGVGLDAIQENVWETGPTSLADGFASAPCWEALVYDDSTSASFGDPAGTGGLSLAVGTQFGPDRVYYGDLCGGAWSTWSTGADTRTAAVAFSADGGEARLASASADAITSAGAVHAASRLSLGLHPNTPTYAILDPPGGPSTGLGFGASTATVADQDGRVPVTFRLIDEQGDGIPAISLEYAVDGTDWAPAATFGALSNLDASPEGIEHALEWDMGADGVLGGDRVRLRLTITAQNPTFIAEPMHHGALSFLSPPGRLYRCFPVDADGDLSVCSDDCDDAEPTVHAGAPEIADDGLDNDCDGDEATTCAPDGDGDGFGTDVVANHVIALGPPGGPDPCPAGTLGDATDCDDGDGDVYPGAAETCEDGVDQDCDTIDAACCWIDGDGDGFGGPDGALGLDGACDGAGLAPTSDDCDDADGAINPDALEVCDGLDNDCNGAADAHPDGELDGDGDGFTPCDPTEPDCDDADPAAWPGAVEDCADSVDQDCDGTEAGGYDDPDCIGGTCSAAASPHPPGAVLFLLAIFAAMRRRPIAGSTFEEAA